MALSLKIAETESEFEQIYQLNYETFVEEIPQHPSNIQKQLRDKFHDKNQYIIALEDGELVAMVAVNDERPFSLDNKITNLESFLPEFHKPLEIRLLAIKQGYRGGRVLFLLIRKMAEWSYDKHYDIAMISGTTLQQKLYTRLGFQVFHPLLGSEEAGFYPMYLSVKAFWETQQHLVITPQS
ncbi:MAG: hypothetical protein RLZZ292_1349 [Bacteroidota bacterium]|jgi:predicted N-acetyltransferase YhbS